MRDMDYHLMLLCFTVTTVLLSSSSSSSANLLTDKEVLLSFKSQITSDPSNTLSSWTAQNMSVCNWTGVICGNHRQRVVGLDLDGLGLSGTISPQISNLSFLHTLNLPNNKFSGIIPDQIGELSLLRTLNLSSNSIQGSIPPNITKCSNLIVLDLQGNQLSGIIPMDLGATQNQLSKLQVIRLSQNRISGTIPPSIGNLSSLTNLDLATNSIGGTIPSDMGRLQNLKELRLSINNLTGTVPSSLYNISSLVYFALPSNNLSGEIPSDVGEKLPNLLEFNFCINKFTGGIPGSLHNLPNIQVIRMAHNLLTGSIPPGLGNLPKLRFYNIGYNRIVSSGDAGLNYVINSLSNTRLEFLALEGNLLEGLIPESVGNLPPTLTKLYMGGNRIYGKIPSSISRLSNLALLDLSHNSISGEIPPEVGSLVNLEMLSLVGNKISGEIPDSLGNLRKLSKLELSGNELEGRIPTTLGNLESLLLLDLSRNRLTGSIPREVFMLSTLTNLLNFSRNSFSGPLPSEIGYLEKLVTIDLSHNSFSGSIPDSIDDCKSLEELFMSHNSLSGPIPATLGAVQGLETLDLSLNQLSGSIPQDLQKLRALQFMNLSFNNLEGRLPTNGVFKNLSRVDIQGNPKLCVSSNSNKWCGIHKKRSTAATRVIITIVASIGLSVLLVSLLCIAFMYKRKGWFFKKLVRGDGSSSDEEFYKGNHQMVSYEELRRATGNFDRENMVGSGSFGSVYKGIIWEGIAVAIKVLNLAQVGASKSFFAECEALRNVRHRNLVKLITSCSSVDFNNSDFRALVYEFLSNGSLEDWIRGRRRHGIDNGDGGGSGDGMNTMERLNVVIDVASALDYLHHDCEVPVVHCDIKPSNVILDVDMTAKVGDFGLARLLVEHSTTNTSTYGLKGSIGYIPPEYGVGGKPSTRGDVYSYGVLLLELFTGRSPTDEGFKGGISLAKWVQSAFPSNITKIVEPDLLLLMGGSDHPVISPQAEQECWVSIMGVGLLCVADSPEARLTIRETLHKLKFIRENLQKPPTDQSKISFM